MENEKTPYLVKRFIKFHGLEITFLAILGLIIASNFIANDFIGISICALTMLFTYIITKHF